MFAVYCNMPESLKKKKTDGSSIKVLLSHLKGQLQQCSNTSLPKTVVAE